MASGRATATQDTGFTVKVDAAGLTAGSAYYYRFSDDSGVVSPVGLTRTLPKADVSAVKFAVFSCSLYSAGYFNAYDAAAKSDAQYAIHLGDYIYEYGSDPAKFGNADAGALGRVNAPANDIVTLDDYRTRYALYRSDPDLQAAHAAASTAPEPAASPSEVLNVVAGIIIVEAHGALPPLNVCAEAIVAAARCNWKGLRAVTHALQLFLLRCTKGEGAERRKGSSESMPRRAARASLPLPDLVVLVLQGGGALGAFQAGVYEALIDLGIELDWVAGISIGAVNASWPSGNMR